MKLKKLFKKISKSESRKEDIIPTHLDYPNFTLYEHVEVTAKKFPKYYAYEYYNNLCTYEEFMKKIDNCARALKAEGVKKGDAVTICMPNTPEAITMFYAVNKIGAVCNMIHPLSSAQEIKYYLNLAESKIILTINVSLEKVMSIIDETKVERVVLASPSEEMNGVMSFLYYVTSGRKIKVEKDSRIKKWKEFISSGKEYTLNTKEDVAMTDTAIILYSGGTTGTPKGIVLSNYNFTALATQGKIMCEPCKEGDTALSIMPIFHGLGLGVCIHIPLTVGMKCVLIPAFQAKKFTQLIKKHKPNFLVGVPTLFEALLKTDLKENELACIKTVACGGDSLSINTKKAIDKFLSDHGSTAQIREGYGLTECSGASCVTPRGLYKEGSIGIPFPDMVYKIVKIGTHEEADVMEDGEICISGPTVMVGYLKNEEETYQTLREHDDGKVWLHTGDIGCMDSEGYIYFKQRLKRMIVSSGYNIYPSQIEKIIASHKSVLSCTVIGVSHPYKGQVAKAYIVLNDGYKPTHELKEEIKAYCEENIAKYALPYEYEYRDSLPKTLIGKVSYKALEDENK
ncbi:MAG: acyl--CoA ligase [Bacillales bacterium]|nr:acyl--CoA ligase [Bacillales bacterium]